MIINPVSVGYDINLLGLRNESQAHHPIGFPEKNGLDNDGFTTSVSKCCLSTVLTIPPTVSVTNVEGTLLTGVRSTTIAGDGIPNATGSELRLVGMYLSPFVQS